MAVSLQPRRPRRPGAGSWRPASHGLPLPFPAETQDGGQQSGTSQRPEMTGQRVGSAGRVRTGQAGGPLSTLASCHRDPAPPDPSAHRRGQRRGLRKQTLSREAQTRSHTCVCVRLLTHALTCSHTHTHTHTHTQGHTDPGRSVSLADGEHPRGAACVLAPWAGRGWPAAPCCPMVASEEGEGLGRGHSGCSLPGHIPGVTWLPPQPGT